jgi:transposase
VAGGGIRQILGERPEMRAPAMLERLRTLGYRGGITIVRDRLRGLRPHAYREPFLILDFPAGEAAQVDWADFGFALPGCPRRVSAFVMALCYSRCLADPEPARSTPQPHRDASAPPSKERQ